MKTGLVLEGGAYRTIFSAGVLDAFLDTGLPLPDYTVGVSAGAAYGVSYISRQSRRNLELICTYANDKRYMGVRNLLDRDNRSYFGLEFAFDTIPNELLPFDFDTFAAYPGVMEAVVTNLNTGRADYLEVPRDDRHCTLIQATCALPLLFPIYHIGGQPYLDGGCADPIPWQHALDMGCDRLVVVLTRERDYNKADSKKQMALIRKAFHEYPRFVETLEQRTAAYNETRQRLFRLEKEGKVLVITPADTRGFSRTERDLHKIRALWQDGYFAGYHNAEKVRLFWNGVSSGSGQDDSVVM